MAAKRFTVSVLAVLLTLSLFAVRSADAVPLGCSVLVLGDSLTVGRKSWAGCLGNLTFVRNESHSGNSAFVESMWLCRLEKGKQCDSAIVFLGTNDISIGRSEADIKQDLTSIYKFLRSEGYLVVGCTIVPRYFFGDPEDARININKWIRENRDGLLDGVIDFDATVRDTKNPSAPASQYVSDDFVHLTKKGEDALLHTLVDFAKE